jgi:hypothetical protein
MGYICTQAFTKWIKTKNIPLKSGMRQIYPLSSNYSMEYLKTSIAIKQVR